MRLMRIVGWLLFAYGAVMLLLLLTPAKDWALDHSIAEVVSYSDRRVDNSVEGSVDEPIAIAGSVAVMFAGLWFALYIPRMFERYQGQMLREAGLDDGHGSGPVPGGPAGPPPSDPGAPSPPV